MYKLEHGKFGWHIKAFIISMPNNQQSTVSTRKLLQSIYATQATVQPFIIPATTPDTIERDIKATFSKDYYKNIWTKESGIRYTWPKHSAEDGIDFSTGLYRRAYAATDWRKVAACTISHMRLWQHCIDLDEPIMILEHDALFMDGTVPKTSAFSYVKIALAGQPKSVTKQYEQGGEQNQPNRFTTEDSSQWTGGIVGINHPARATRKARTYLSKVEDACNLQVGSLVPVPYVDDPGEPPLPNGLAGNSAYIIKPWAAKKLLEKTAEIGIWPNDALMCKQFFPWLQQSYPFYTMVQGTPSTTTT